MLRTLGQYMVGSAATFGYTYLGIVEGRTTMLTRGPASSCPSARQYEQRARPSSQKHSGRHKRGMALPQSCRSRESAGQRWRSTGHEQVRGRCRYCTNDGMFSIAKGGVSGTAGACCHMNVWNFSSCPLYVVTSTYLLAIIPPSAFILSLTFRDDPAHFP